MDTSPAPRAHDLPATPVKKWSTAYAELSSPCGRFAFAAPRSTRAEWAAQAFLERIGLSRGSAVPDTGIPENWRALVRFLHEHGITRSRFRPFGSSRYLPHLETYGLTIERSKFPTDGHIPAYDGGFAGGFVRDETLSKTVGETLERFFLSTYRRGVLPFGSFRSIASGSAAPIDPERLRYFLPWQSGTFPEFRWGDDTQFRWTEGRSMRDDVPVLLPAQIVWWNYRHEGESVIMRPTTSGCAGHFSRTEATLAALLELIQRDGFLIFWLNRISPPVLNVSTLESPEIDRIVETARTHGVELTFLDTTSDLPVPSVTCIATDARDPAQPSYAVGAGTSFDIVRAIVSAATEAIGVLEYAANGTPHTLPDSYRPFCERDLTREIRLRIWKGARMQKEIAFLFEGTRTDARSLVRGSSASSAETELERVLEILHKRGYNAYRFEAKDPLLSTLGYHAVRVIVPELVPLYLSEYAAPLAAPRLREVPVALGYSAADTFNPWPHPFP